MGTVSDMEMIIFLSPVQVVSVRGLWTQNYYIIIGKTLKKYKIK